MLSENRGIPFEKMNQAIIILAAGNASRMGEAKQLLPFKGTTFIQHIVEEAVKTVGENTILVLGAYADEIQLVLGKTAPKIAMNENWHSGMAGSIQTGMNLLLEILPETENVIITLADQPFVSAILFQQIFGVKERSGKNIIACRYDGTIGVPVLFNKKYFSELLQLQGGEGAKKIIQKHIADVLTVDFEKGAIDIDTEEDYQLLNELFKNQN